MELNIKPQKFRMNPALIHTNGKTFIVPGCIEVPNGTTLEDIQPYIIKEERKIETKTQENFHKIVNSGDNVYMVTFENGYWSCGCKGKMFHPDKDCKHIKQVKESLKNSKNLVNNS